MAGALVVVVMVALVYLPGHVQASTRTEIVTGIAAMFAMALVVGVPRALSGFALRKGGSPDPIVLLGPAFTALESGAISPARRATAITVGASSALLIALGAAQLAAAAAPGEARHAIAGLAAATSFATLSVMSVPIPGLPAWAAVLTWVDAHGGTDATRIARAARLAKGWGLVVGAVAATVTIAGGAPLLAPLGLVLVTLVWVRSGMAATADAARRFFAWHVAGDLATPLCILCRVGDIVVPTPRSNRGNVSIVVDAAGSLAGFLGPRQLKRASGLADAHYGDVMVTPLAVSIIPGGAPATSLLPLIDRVGFVLVHDPDGVGFVESADLARQMRIWRALEGRLRQPDPRPRDKGAADC